MEGHIYQMWSVLYVFPVHTSFVCLFVCLNKKWHSCGKYVHESSSNKNLLFKQPHYYPVLAECVRPSFCLQRCLQFMCLIATVATRHYWMMLLNSLFQPKESCFTETCIEIPANRYALQVREADYFFFFFLLTHFSGAGQSDHQW